MKENQREPGSIRSLAGELLRRPLCPEEAEGELFRLQGMEPTEGAAVVLAQLKRAKEGSTQSARFLQSLTEAETPEPGEETDLRRLSDDALWAIIARCEPGPGA